MENPKISVIVPVYNVEKYLHRCVDSILAQTFKDFELLLIDDGSKDRSGDICDEYAKLDERVKVWHKENGGVSSARQVGLNNAVGEYIIHADPDDWVNANMLEEMYGMAKDREADIVLADFYRDTESAKDVYEEQCVLSLTADGLLKQILDCSIHGSLCNKLIKSSCYLNCNAHFISGINYCEDALILCQLLLGKLKVTKIDKAYYHYTNDNEMSISKDYNLGKYKQRKLYVEALDKLLPHRYHIYIEKTAFYVKAEAFNYGIVRTDDLRNFYPLSLYPLLLMKTAKSVKLSFIFAMFNLDYFVKVIAKRYNKNNKKIDIQ